MLHCVSRPVSARPNSSHHWKRCSTRALIARRENQIHRLSFSIRVLNLPYRVSAAGLDFSSEEVDLDEEMKENVWRSVPKCLMTVGRQGVQSSHCSSLTDLITSHKLVKVKVLFTTDIEAAIEKLSSETGAVHLQSKGDVLLFASGELKQGELQQFVEDSLEKQEMAKQKREQERQIKRAPPSSVQLPRSVKQILQSMEDKRMICSITFDTQTKQLLSRLPEKSQLEILSSIKKKELSRVRNKSAWLTSRIKVHQKALDNL